MFKKQILYEYFKLSSNIICLNMIPNYTLNIDNFLKIFCFIIIITYRQREGTISTNI